MEKKRIDLVLNLGELENVIKNINILKTAGFLENRNVINISLTSEAQFSPEVSKILQKSSAKKKLKESSIQEIEGYEPQKKLKFDGYTTQNGEPLNLIGKKPIHRKSHIYYFADKLKGKIMKKLYMTNLTEFGVDNNIEFKLENENQGFIEYFYKNDFIENTGFVEDYLAGMEQIIAGNIKSKEIIVSQEEANIINKILTKFQNHVVNIENLIGKDDSFSSLRDLNKNKYIINNEFVLKIIEESPLALQPNFILCNMTDNGIFLDEITMKIFQNKKLKNELKKANPFCTNVKSFEVQENGFSIIFLIQIFKEEYNVDEYNTHIQKNLRSIFEEIQARNMYFSFVYNLLQDKHQIIIKEIFSEFQNSIVNGFERMTYPSEIIIATKDSNQTEAIIKVIDKIKTEGDFHWIEKEKKETQIKLELLPQKWASTPYVNQMNFNMIAGYPMNNNIFFQGNAIQTDFPKEVSDLIEKAYNNKEKEVFVLMMDNRYAGTFQQNQGLIYTVNFQNYMINGEQDKKEINIFKNTEFWHYIDDETANVTQFPYPVSQAFDFLVKNNITKIKLYGIPHVFGNPIYMHNNLYGYKYDKKAQEQGRMPKFMSVTQVLRIDLITMISYNLTTNNLQNSVVRIPDYDAAKKAQEEKPKPIKEFEIEQAEIDEKEENQYAGLNFVKVRGYDKDFDNLVTEIDKKLKSKIIKHNIPLSCINSSFQDFVKDICKKNNLQIEFDTQKKYISLEGNRKTINKIRSEIIKASQINFDSFEIPKEWTLMSGKKYLEVNVDLNSEEGNLIQNLFVETLMGSKINSIIRIQNISLWQNYCYERNKMKERGNATELLLFHGTRETDPKIISRGTEEGFDVRLSRAGAYGRGIYFAEDASYSFGYAHIKGQSKFFFLALVLVGNPFVSPSNQQLCRPPSIPGTDQRYDSVTTINYSHGQRKQCPVVPGGLYMGTRGRGAFFMVYDNHKAYPYYLIEFR